MKALKLGIPLVFIFLSSCYFWQSNWYDTYTLHNGTSHTIQAVAFSNLFGDIDTIILNSNESHTRKVRLGELRDCCALFNIPEDSIVMIFDYEKTITYYRCDSIPECNEIRSPTNYLSAYQERCPRNVGCDYTYTITEEDYEMAEFINKE